MRVSNNTSLSIPERYLRATLFEACSLGWTPQDEYIISHNNLHLYYIYTEKALILKVPYKQGNRDGHMLIEPESATSTLECIRRG